MIAFNRFRYDAATDYARALDRLADTDGLIVDLRGNPVGNIGAMMSFAQNFFPDTRHVLTRRSRIFETAADSELMSVPQRYSPEVRINANARAYTRPLAILVDEYSASSSELLATMLREQRDAYIVGRPTCGCVVAVRSSGYRLAGGGALYVAETGFVTPSGNRMEGAGMRPDARIAMTLADLRNGIDRDVAVARKWLAGKAREMARSERESATD
jgi:carboxyl-terminal processing protease